MGAWGSPPDPPGVCRPDGEPAAGSATSRESMLPSSGEIQIVTRGPGETEAEGERLAATLGPGDVVALVGELGAGKTCFVQGLVRGLGVAIRATSPTFVLINEYQGRWPVHHVDAYRTSSLTELMDLGLPELFDEDGVTLVEWADRLDPLLPARAVRVTIEGVGDESRRITIRRGATGVSISAH